jgi:hypothetical protein
MTTTHTPDDQLLTIAEVADIIRVPVANPSATGAAPSMNGSTTKANATRAPVTAPAGSPRPPRP